MIHILRIYLSLSTSVGKMCRHEFGHKFSRPGARDFCQDVSIVDLSPASIDNPLTAQHVTMQ